MADIDIKKKILIISHDKIGTAMAGPGIRYHYMAETLTSTGFDVTIGFFSPEYLPDNTFKRSYNVESIDVHRFQEAFTWADAIIALWVSEAIIDYCNINQKILIIDMYSAVPVENLALKIFSNKSITEADEFTFQSSLNDYRKFLENGDAFLYSNRRQLDFWIGYAMGANQISPLTFKKRNVYNQFLSAPMGISTSEKLLPGKPLYKGALPGVAKDDIVIIWDGGIYDWYDGITLVEAMELVLNINPKIKIIFPGTQHPNKTLPKWQETINTQSRAKELNLIDKNVFFFNNWVDYHERVGFLLEADMAIYTHKPSIESEFSHRTRVLDHILACLPTIATEGDYFADLVNQNGLGIVVPPYNKTALADAIVDLAKPSNLEKARENLKKIRPEFDWKVTLEPLVAYLNTNPNKVHQIRSFKIAPLQKGKAGFVRHHTPIVIKKAIVRSMPPQIRKKILGR